jgi:hypothetical protein
VIIDTLLDPRLKPLTDPQLSLEFLVTIRQIADSVKVGFLDPPRANEMAARLSPKFSDVFEGQVPEAAATPVIEIIGAIIAARVRHSARR